MFKMLMHAARVVHAVAREHVGKRAKRSPEWPTTRKKFIKANPTCAACGGTTLLQVHHRHPFHAFPELELDPGNLVVLCMGPLECHIYIGHGGSFSAFSPTVIPDSAEVLADPAKFKEVAQRAEENRIPNTPSTPDIDSVS